MQVLKGFPSKLVPIMFLNAFAIDPIPLSRGHLPPNKFFWVYSPIQEVSWGHADPRLEFLAPTSFWKRSSLVTNSIRISKSMIQCKQPCVLQIHYQGLCQLFSSVTWDLCASHDTPDGVLVSLEFWKQQMRWGWGHLKGVVSSKKSPS